MTRNTLAIGLPACLLALLAACGGGGGGSDAPRPQGELRSASEGAVVAYFKERLAQRAARGLDPDPATLPVAAPSVSADALDFAGTQLQEQGVDEDDRLKTDGRLLYALHPSRWENTATVPGRLAAARIQADGALQDLGSYTLPTDADATGMYLAAGRLALLSQKQVYGNLDAMSLVRPARRSVAVDLFAVSESAAPAPQHRIEMDGWLVGSRRIGNVLYVVSSWNPNLAQYRLPADATPAQVDAALADLDAAQILPTVRVDGGAPQPLVDETACFLQPENASLALQLTTVTAIDLAAADLRRNSVCFVGDSNTLYMSPQAVYVASSKDVWMATALASTVFPRATSVDIHKFALDGMAIDYRGSGHVAGHLGWDSEKMPYRMSEYQGNLRVVSYTGATGWSGPIAFTPKPGAGSPATLTVLREDPATRSLVTLATLPNAQRPAPLGKAGEQVYAVHFAGDRGYVVTFRRTDPLYVLDLANPADPKAVGELEMPGYSDYLYPLANGQLLGVGKGATADGLLQGLKIALFDVRDAAAPRMLASLAIGERGSASALDSSRHGINLLVQGERTRVALPVHVWETTGGMLRPSYQGLARLEVDTAAGTLVQHPLVLATRFDGTSADWQRYARFDLGMERAVQTTQGSYYLSGGTVSYTPAP